MKIKFLCYKYNNVCYIAEKKYFHRVQIYDVNITFIHITP